MRCSRRLLGEILDAFVHDVGSPLSEYRPSAKSNLISDYFASLSNVFKLRFHYPIFFALRKSGMRCLFLAPGYTVPKDATLFTVPLTSVITPENISQRKYADPKLTVEEVRNNIIFKEFHLLAPQITMGLQFAHMISQLPSHQPRPKTDEENVRLCLLEKDEMMPWCRMLDDENWDEDFIRDVYVNCMGPFEQESYGDLAEKFKRITTAIQHKMKLDEELEDIRRMVRIAIARFDLTPPAEEIAVTGYRRAARNTWRRLRGQKPPQNISIVPLLDMLNHSFSPNVIVRTGISPELKVPSIMVKAVRPIEEGEEIVRNYNFAMDKAAALFRYGFLPHGISTLTDVDHYRDTYIKKMRPQLMDADTQTQEKEEKLEKEVDRLQSIYQKARSGAYSEKELREKPKPKKVGEGTIEDLMDRRGFFKHGMLNQDKRDDYGYAPVDDGRGDDW